MPQNLVLKNFIKYLTITSKNYLKELNDEKAAAIKKALESINDEEIQKLKDRIKLIDKIIPEHVIYINELKEKLEKGYCHGFSICLGAMNSIGKFEWWKHVLVALANWDGTEEALQKEMHLPGEVQPQTLEQLIFRAFYYIVCCQADFEKHAGFGLKGAEQSNLLQPVVKKTNKKYFEILNEDNNLLEIKNWVVVGGHFTQEDLLALLDGDQIKENICKIESEDHTTQIVHHGKEWMLYNPNYDHTQLATLLKIGSKEEIIAEIILLLGEDLTLTIATTKDQPLSLPYFDYMLQNKKMDLIKQNGFNHFVRSRPKDAKQLLKLAENDPKLLSAITEALLVKGVTHWTGLHTLAYYAPAAADILIQLIEKTKDTKLLTTVVETLLEKDKHNWSGLHMLTRYAPDVVRSLFQLMDKELLIFDTIVKALPEQDKKNWTLLHMLSRYVPEATDRLFQLATETNDRKLLAAIRKALPKKNIYNITAAYMVSCYAPAAAHQLYRLIEKAKDKKLLAILSSSLLMVDDENWTEIHILARHAPKATAKLVQLAVKDSQLLWILSEALPKKNIHGWTVLHMLMRYAPKALDRLFQAIENEKDPRLIDYVSKALLEKIDNWPVLQMFAKHAPAAGDRLFQLAVKTENPQLLAAIVKILSEKNNNNETIFHIKPQWNALLPVINKLLSSEINVYNNLQAIIKTLAAVNQTNQSGWQKLSQGNNAKAILNVIKKSLENLNQDELTDFNRKLKEATYNPNAEYKGLYIKRPQQLLFKNDDKITDIRRVLMSKVKNLLHGASVQEEGQEVMSNHITGLKRSRSIANISI